MNLSTKQTLGHREQTDGCQGGGEGLGGGMEWEFGINRRTLTLTYRMDKQQGPYCVYRELYSISYNKPSGKRWMEEV